MNRVTEREVRDLACTLRLKVQVQKNPTWAPKDVVYDFYVGDDVTWKKGGPTWIGQQSFSGAREAYTFLRGFTFGQKHAVDLIERRVK